MKYDTCVVGAGPIGALSAFHAADAGDVLIIKEHRKQPVHCAGIISKAGLAKIGVNPKSSLIQEVKGAKIYGPGGTHINISPKKHVAAIVDRSLFDEEVLEKALNAGVVVARGRVEKIINDEIVCEKKKFRAETKVIACGTDYTLPRRMGLNTPFEFLYGAQAEVKMELDPDFVEIYFNVPGFFTWIIPAGDVVRVGLATKSNPTPYLERFMAKLKKEDRLKKTARVKQRVYGVIPLHYPRLKTQYDSIRLVGDSAGHVKATTGGGVVMGGIAAKYAHQSNYEKRWRKDIGSELRKHLWVYRFLHRLTPENKQRLFTLTAKHHQVLEETGDMDYASKTLGGLLHHKRFLLGFVRNLPYFIPNLL